MIEFNKEGETPLDDISGFGVLVMSKVDFNPPLI